MTDDRMPGTHIYEVVEGVQSGRCKLFHKWEEVAREYPFKFEVCTRCGERRWDQTHFGITPSNDVVNRTKRWIRFGELRDVGREG